MGWGLPGAPAPRACAILLCALPPPCRIQRLWADPRCSHAAQPKLGCDYANAPLWICPWTHRIIITALKAQPCSRHSKLLARGKEHRLPSGLQSCSLVNSLPSPISLSTPHVRWQRRICPRAHPAQCGQPHRSSPKHADTQSTHLLLLQTGALQPEGQNLSASYRWHARGEQMGRPHRRRRSGAAEAGQQVSHG